MAGGGLQRRYSAALRVVLRARWVVVGAYLVATLGTVLFLGRGLGLEIFPSVESG